MSKCRARRADKKHRRCLECRKAFFAYRKTQFLCSRKCAGRYHAKRGTNRKHARANVCLQCRKEFVRIGGPRGGFCSQKCFQLSLKTSVEIACSFCGSKVKRLRSLKDLARANDHAFCNESCSRQYHHQKSGPIGWAVEGVQPMRPDGEFYVIWDRARKRGAIQGYPFTISVDDVKKAWLDGNGTCPVTGWKLTLPHGTLGYRKRTPRHQRASLDRIDSSKGYEPGNIRLTCIMANFAKGSFLTDEHTIAMCRSVVDKSRPCPYPPCSQPVYPRGTRSCPFTRMLYSRRAKGRGNSRKSVDVTHSDIKKLWEAQNGRCRYTGWSLVLPRSGTWEPGVPDALKASLDRVDSTKGYVLDNVQFISLAANLAKNNFSESEFLTFCQAVDSQAAKSKKYEPSPALCSIQGSSLS